MNIALRRALPVTLALIFLGPPALAAWPRAETPPAELRGCLREATARAIELEIDSYRRKLQAALAGTGQQENAAKIRQRLVALEEQQQSFDRMPPDAYPDPATSPPAAPPVLDPTTANGPMIPAELREAVVVVTLPYDIGSLLEVEGTSRSGPFFRLAGIAGGDAGILRSVGRHRVSMYLVYRREYFGFIGDYYVYVAGER